jgi:hypothetical protein
LQEHERIDLRRSESERPKPSERRGLGVHDVESRQVSGTVPGTCQSGSRIAG